MIEGHQQQVRALQSRLEVKQSEVTRLERHLDRISATHSAEMSPAYGEGRRYSTGLDLQEQLNLMLLHRSTETEDLQYQLAAAQVGKKTHLYH